MRKQSVSHLQQVCNMDRLHATRMQMLPLMRTPPLMERRLVCAYLAPEHQPMPRASGKQPRLARMELKIRRGLHLRGQRASFRCGCRLASSHTAARLLMRIQNGNAPQSPMTVDPSGAILCFAHHFPPPVRRHHGSLRMTILQATGAQAARVTYPFRACLHRWCAPSATQQEFSNS